MSLKLLTLVASESFSEEDVNNFCKNNFNLFIKDSKALSNNAVQLTIDKSDNIQSTDIEQILDSKKVDFCIQEKTDTQYKILLCDMDATMIANETLDDLVKLTGVKTNIDETSKLAMEGKIDLRTTLKNRVELLKGHPKSLIDEVKNGIRFNAGAETLIKTLNSHGLITNLVTGGFEPISTYVGEKLEFHNIISNQFIFDKNDCFTGEYHLINGEKNSKYKYMETISSNKNISFQEMVSVGDGSNDLQMLKHSGLGIGYHAHQIIKDNINYQIKFTDLKSVLFYLGIQESQFID